MLPLRDINPRQSTPVVTVALIAADAPLFSSYELSLGERLETFVTAWG